jgi:hypothetical protein
MDIDHPAVELRLPVDGGHYQFAVPRETTHFYWGILQAGFESVDSPPADSHRRYSVNNSLSNARDQISWELIVNGESISFMKERYYNGDGSGPSWWAPIEPPTFPATVTSRVTTTGEIPTADGEEISVWGTNGTRVPWSETITTTFELSASDTPASRFENRSDGLWDRHTVYIPESNPVQSDRD